MTNKTAGFLVTKRPPQSLVAASDFSETSPFSEAGALSFGAQHSQQSFAGSTTSSVLQLRQGLESLRIPPSPSSLSPSAKTLEERLFDATAGVKMMTAQIAMHLDREWRDRLFKQLDSLHDPEEWEPEDEPIQQASFATFLKGIFRLMPAVRPGLGLSHNGFLLAAWTAGKNRLTIEFMPNDQIRWVISRYPDGELEQVAGQTVVSRLVDALSPYAPGEWLGNVK